MEKELKIGVIGSGAIGGALASLLVEKNFDVELTFRYKNVIKVDGKISFDIISDKGSHSNLIKCVDGIDNFSNNKDIIFISTRSNAVVDCIEKAKLHLKNNGVIVIISNTFIYQDIFAESKNIFGMYINWSIDKINVTQIKISSLDSIILGKLSEALDERLLLINGVLDEIAFVETVNNFRDVVASRIALNSVISALCTVSNLRLGKLLKNYFGKKLFLELLKEAVYIFKANSIQLLPYNGIIDYNLFIKNDISSNIKKGNIIKKIIKYNSHITALALLDIENGRKSETDYLLGRIYKMGESFSVKSPYIKTTLYFIEQAENGNRSLCEENLELIYKNKI